MGITIVRKEVDLDNCFPEDVDQYYDVANGYANLTTEDYSTAFQLSQKAWILAGKLASISKVNKTDLKDYCYRKYRQMQYIHEHCRMIWNKGEQAEKEKRVGR